MTTEIPNRIANEPDLTALAQASAVSTGVPVFRHSLRARTERTSTLVFFSWGSLTKHLEHTGTPSSF